MKSQASIWIPAARLLAGVAFAAWLWHCWCIFPSLVWNELRLEPTFLLAAGHDIYPAPGTGPVSTWIYGPLPVVVMLPVLFAANAATALMLAGAINLALVIGPITYVLLRWPISRPELPTAERWAIVPCCLAAWPFSSLQFLQADNVAVACGLLSNLVLVLDRANRNRRWVAAAIAMAAVASKQTAVGCLVAQLIWLTLLDGWKSALGYAFRLGAVAAIVGIVLLVFFTPFGLWLNLYELPRGIPFTREWVQRTYDLAPLLGVHLLGPVLILAIAGRDRLRAGSPLLLPTLSWLTSLLPGLLSLYKIGGTINSLEGWLLFLPAGLLALAARLRSRHRVVVGFSIAAFALLLCRLLPLNHLVLSPRIHHIQQANVLIAQQPGQLWCPWNPLITYFAEHRFDHVEDGLYVRFLAGRPMPRAEAQSHLPPDWHGMLILRGSSDWGLASHLCPPQARTEEAGMWTVYRWE